MSTDHPKFKDHFSGHASDYASFRPTYPEALFGWLARQSPARQLAWDCATGNGQAALALADHFKEVVATDASRKQLEQARKHPRISYRAEPAEQSSLYTGSVDLVTVAQAYHWFNHDAFLSEVARVLKPGGLFAIWTYTLARIENDVDDLVLELYEPVLGSYWPEERAYIDRDYRDFDMPWNELEVPQFSMTTQWSLDQLMGYLGTWSALRRYVREHGINPLDDFRTRFVAAWGSRDETKSIRWPLVLKVCRKPG